MGHRQITKAGGFSSRAPSARGGGPYLLQATIADLHLQQPRDWRQIADLYERLAVRTRSPIVELNRAVAVAELEGPEAGLAILGRLDLASYRYFHSARVPSSCVAPAGPRRHATPIDAPSSWPTPTPNADRWSHELATLEEPSQ